MIPPPGGTSWQDAKLTPRQLVVAELYADGESVAAIAAGLCISPNTVRVHLEQIGLRVGGPGTRRARITRYMRGRRDAALRAQHQTTPTPWEKAS